MTDHRKVMRMALEALEPLLDADIDSRPGYAIEDYHTPIRDAIESLRAALAEPAETVKMVALTREQHEDVQLAVRQCIRLTNARTLELLALLGEWPDAGQEVR